MSPALIALIIQGIEAAIKLAPTVVDIAQKGKAFIASLFSAGLITADVQNALHAHIDAFQASAIAGEVPVHWQVQPDPAP